MGGEHRCFKGLPLLHWLRTDHEKEVIAETKPGHPEHFLVVWVNRKESTTGITREGIIRQETANTKIPRWGRP